MGETDVNLRGDSAMATLTGKGRVPRASKILSGTGKPETDEPESGTGDHESGNSYEREHEAP